MWHNIWRIFVCTWEIYVFCYYYAECPVNVWWVLYFKLWLNFSVSLLIFCLNVYPLLKVECQSLLVLLYCHLFLPLGLLILLYMFRCSCVGCINIYKYISLLAWSFYCKMTFLSSCSLCLKVFFVWYKYSCPSFILVSICM